MERASLFHSHTYGDWFRVALRQEHVACPQNPVGGGANEFHCA
jgi:hypothetical protein